VWVAVFGGTHDEAPLKVVQAGANLIVAAQVSSTDAPATVEGSARGTGNPDLLLMGLDANTGHLKQSAYAGLTTAITFSSAVLVTADPASTISGSVGQYDGERLWGRVWRWNPETGRFLFQTDIELPAESISSSPEGRLDALWRGWDGALRALSLSPTGESSGPGVIVAPPGASWRELGPVVEDTGGAFYTGIFAQEDVANPARETAYLLWLNPTTGATRPPRRLAEASGFPYLGRTRAGHLKFLLQRPGPHEATTADALYRQPCDGVRGPGLPPEPSGYFGILSSAEEPLYASYVLNSESDATAQDEPSQPAAPHACAANSVAAPGSWFVVHGGGFGPGEAWELGPAADGRFPTEAEGLRLRIDGRDMPLYRVGPGRVEGQIPFETTVSGEFQTVELSRNGQRLASLPVLVQTSAPRALPTGKWDRSSGKDLLVAWNEDGTRNSVQNPARAGQLVAILGTGLGALDPPLRTGELAPGAEGTPLSASGIRFHFDGASEAVFLGAAAGLPTAVWQAVVRLPEGEAAAQPRLHPIRLSYSHLCGLGRICEVVLADGLIRVQ